MPVGFGLARIALLFGTVEAIAGILFVVLMGKTIRPEPPAGGGSK